MTKKYEIPLNSKFGKLTTVSKPYKNEKGKYVCDCICECGNKCSVIVYSLLSGTTKSCGCLRKTFHNPIIIHEGDKFGYYTVIGEPFNISNKRGFYIKVKCEKCGKIFTLSKTNLLSKYKKDKQNTMCSECRKKFKNPFKHNKLVNNTKTKFISIRSNNYVTGKEINEKIHLLESEGYKIKSITRLLVPVLVSGNKAKEIVDIIAEKEN